MTSLLSLQLIGSCKFQPYNVLENYSLKFNEIHEVKVSPKVGAAFQTNWKMLVLKRNEEDLIMRKKQ